MRIAEIESVAVSVGLVVVVPVLVVVIDVEEIPLMLDRQAVLDVHADIPPEEHFEADRPGDPGSEQEAVVEIETLDPVVVVVIADIDVFPDLLDIERRAESEINPGRSRRRRVDEIFRRDPDIAQIDIPEITHRETVIPRGENPGIVVIRALFGQVEVESEPLVAGVLPCHTETDSAILVAVVVDDLVGRNIERPGPDEMGMMVSCRASFFDSR